MPPTLSLHYRLGLELQAAFLAIKSFHLFVDFSNSYLILYSLTPPKKDVLPFNWLVQKIYVNQNFTQHQLKVVWLFVKANVALPSLTPPITSGLTFFAFVYDEKRSWVQIEIR
jgi:hypothetical protein